MLQIRLERLQMTGIYCTHHESKKDPKYHINIIGDVWSIKVYSPELWAFH